MIKSTIIYVPPRCEYDYAFRVDLLCTSPEEGGLEDIGDMDLEELN